MLGSTLIRRLVQWSFKNCFETRTQHGSASSVEGNSTLLNTINLSVISKRAKCKKNKKKIQRACKNGGHKNSKSKFKSKLVSIKEAHRFMKDCFMALKTPAKNANEMADLLVAADYRGHQSHGMNRLEMYLKAIEAKCISPCAIPCVICQTPATAWVDGRSGLGAVIGNYCMDLAIRKAQEVGVGWVCVKGSTHYGIAAWYTERAMRKGLVGITMTNTLTLVTPTHSKESCLGTNPISVGASGNKDKFLLDMATSAVAVGKIEMKLRRGEPIPKNWAQDAHGRVTTNAKKAFSAGCLLPLGGSEANSGYKGYGLSCMIDMLSGVMSGANYSNLSPKWGDNTKDRKENLGQVFIAVDPECFVPDFKDRLSDFLSRLRKSKPVDPSKPVLVPGDKEEFNKKAVDKAGGIQYLENQLKACSALAKRLKVKPLKFI